jgi:hypothetical protein
MFNDVWGKVLYSCVVWLGLQLHTCMYLQQVNIKVAEICKIPKNAFWEIWCSEMGVGIATGYGLDGRGVLVWIQVGTRFFSSPSSPDWFWCPLSLLSSGYRGFFPQGLRSPGVKLATDLHLGQRPRIRGSFLHRSSWRSGWLVKHRDKFTFML